MKYLYTYGLSGVVDAPSEEHARMQLLMGISLSSRVAALGPDIVIRVEKIEEKEAETNGAQPKRRQKSAAKPQLFEH